jgi:hypothetical protein
MSKKPAVPRRTGPSGRALWKAVVDDYELERHELELLKQAVRCADDLDRLAEIVDREGVVVGEGSRRVHPALVESRQMRVTMARVLGALRLPGGLTGKSPQRRMGVRRPYLQGIA